MAYSKNIITMDEAIERVACFPFALVYQISEVRLGKTDNIENPWKEMLEARFFSKTGELHIFRCEKEWKAVEISDDEKDDETRFRRYNLANEFRGEGNIIIVKDYLAEDEDGQMYIERTRLFGIEF